MSSSDPFELPDIDPAAFRQALGRFPTGVTVVTASTSDGPGGLAIGSFFSVSLDPPLVGFCVGRTSSSWARLKDAGHFVVNVLSADQADVSNRFASKDADRFAGLETSPGIGGAPRLAGCLATIDCVAHAVHDGGDHDIVVGRVVNLAVGPDDASPLLFFKGGYGRHVSL